MKENTPHAFAHFTYESSKHSILVCDIQGVNDIYTDPQVHTLEHQKSFGKGNLGQKGFDNFLRTHRCNRVCQYLKLPNISGMRVEDIGTIPAATFMLHEQIGTVMVDVDDIATTYPLLHDQTFPTLHDERCCKFLCCTIL